VPFVSDTATSTASRPAFVTIAKRPTIGTERRIDKAVSTERRSEIFLQRPLDSEFADQPVRQISWVD
jgi:hypothetical protein